MGCIDSKISCTIKYFSIQLREGENLSPQEENNRQFRYYRAIIVYNFAMIIACQAILILGV